MRRFVEQSMTDMSQPQAPAASQSAPAPAPSSQPTVAAPAATSGDDAITPDHVRMVLRRVKDPELNLNIVDLGLIYDVTVSGSAVAVDMSLTSPGCPSGPEIMSEAEQQIREMPGVTDATINLVWTPFWSPDRIEPRVRAYLGI
jgi:metal-sulfur cluster biosynthetic enzyme